MRIVERDFVCQVRNGEGGWLDLYVGRLDACSYYGSGPSRYNRVNIHRHGELYSEFYLKIKRK